MAAPRRPAAAGDARYQDGQVKSLHRALDLLEALADTDREVTLSGLADRFGMPPSTVHRLLSTLGERGYVVQNPETGRYRIGVRAFEVGAGFLRQWGLREIARPVMDSLMAATGETVNLAIRDQNSAVYIDQVECAQMVRSFTHVGARVPLHCTGVGKVLISRLSPAEIRGLLRRRGLERYTPLTITRMEDLLAELQEIEANGYALDRQEYSADVRCVAAPVFNDRADIVAALSVTGPAFRVTPERLAPLALQARAAALRISAGLGYRPERRAGAGGRPE